MLFSVTCSLVSVHFVHEFFDVGNRSAGHVSSWLTVHKTFITGVCKYYIGPIGDLSLLTAAAAAAAAHSPTDGRKVSKRHAPVKAMGW